jgi:hypothetical protein
MPRKLTDGVFDAQHLVTEQIVGFAATASVAQEPRIVMATRGMGAGPSNWGKSQSTG